MESFNYYLPTEIFFGEGTLNKVGEVGRRFGFKCLIVTGKSSTKKTGVLDRVISSLIINNIKDVLVFDEIEPNPTDKSVNKAADIATKESVDFIIALGGGSVLDSAKAVSIVSSNEGYAWDFVLYPEGPKSIPYYNRPLIAIPTTAGTGSEVNKYAVISNPVRKEKLVIAHSLCYPKVAIVDPKLTYSMDEDLTKTTGIDAFFHAFESFTNIKINYIADEFASKALKEIPKNLTVLMEDLQNEKARKSMSYSSMIAGIAIDQKRAGIIHVLEHPLSGRYPDIAHAKGLSALSLYVLKFNIENKTPTYKKLLDLFGFEKETQILDFLLKLLERLNLPTSIKELGVKREDIDILTEDVFLTARNALEINPVPLSIDDVRKIYEMSYEKAL